jgi:hypothetical protein
MKVIGSQSKNYVQNKETHLNGGRQMNHALEQAKENPLEVEYRSFHCEHTFVLYSCSTTRGYLTREPCLGHTFIALRVNIFPLFGVLVVSKIGQPFPSPSDSHFNAFTIFLWLRSTTAFPLGL